MYVKAIEVSLNFVAIIKSGSVFFNVWVCFFGPKLYIYIYMCVCVCVCVCARGWNHISFLYYGATTGIFLESG